MAGYGDLARIYDGEYGRMAADLDMYLRLLGDERIRGPVLELGCGTGRIAIPIASAGHRVTGVDLSEAMLRRARARRRALPSETQIRLRFSHQDMRRFRFAYRFDAAAVGFSTFNLLPTAADRSACLEQLRAALNPGAPLLLDLAAPDRAATAATPMRFVSRFVLPPQGHVVDKLVEQRLDPLRNVLTVRYEYRVQRWVDDVEVDRMTVEFEFARIERSAVERGLYDAGFDVESVAGDYRGTPFHPGAARLVIVARRL